MLRRVALRIVQRFWRMQRGLTLGVRGIIIDGDGRIVLVRHTYMPGWTFPGGGVEFGETLEAALDREIEEEAGIVRTGPAILFGVYSNHDLFPGDHVAVYLVREWRQARPAAANHEIAEVAFFSPDKLPADITAGAQRRLDEWLQQRPQQSTW